MRHRRESEVHRPESGERPYTMSRHDSLCYPEDITPTLKEITTIYEKVKKGRDNESYCVTTKFGAPSTHPDFKSLDNEQDETMPLEPSFPSSGHGLDQNQYPTSSSPVRYLDFNMCRGFPNKKYLFFSTETKTLLSDTLEGLSPHYPSLLKSKNYWLNITDPNEVDLAMLSNSFNVHGFTISDIRETNTEEKIEFYQHYTFMSTRLLREFKIDEEDHENNGKNEESSAERPKYHDQDPRKYPRKKGKKNSPVDMDFNILLFKNFVITMHDKPWGSINDILGFVNLVSTEITLTPDWVLYSVFIELAQDAHYLLSEIEPLINEMRISRTQNTQEMSRVLHENYQMEFQLYAIQRFLKPKVHILRTLKLKAGRRFGRILLNLLNEIREDFMEMNYDLRNLNHMLERSQDTFLALVNVEKSKEANEMSLIMERLSQIALIFLPIQAISGFFGMNVIVPWQDENTSMYFWLLVGLSVLIGTIMYLCKSLILNQFKCSQDNGTSGSKVGCCGGRRKSKKFKQEPEIRPPMAKIPEPKHFSSRGPSFSNLRQYQYEKI